jgi:hypothetical protein
VNALKVVLAALAIVLACVILGSLMAPHRPGLAQDIAVCRALGGSVMLRNSADGFVVDRCALPSLRDE